jgi:hypothetical protein
MWAWVSHLFWAKLLMRRALRLHVCDVWVLMQWGQQGERRLRRRRRRRRRQKVLNLFMALALGGFRRQNTE